MGGIPFLNNLPFVKDVVDILEETGISDELEGKFRDKFIDPYLGDLDEKQSKEYQEKYQAAPAGFDLASGLALIAAGAVIISMLGRKM